MRRVEIGKKVSGRSAASIYSMLRDFKKYPEYTNTVRAVDLIQVDEDRTVSSWEVNFNRGILRWTEEDHFDVTAYSIDFHQISGDIDHFSGQWRIREDGDTCVILFTADFDLGIPSLSDMLEPIAEQALRENIQAILEGLLSHPIEQPSTVQE